MTVSTRSRTVLEEKLVKRGVSLKGVDYGDVQDATQNTVRQVVTIKVGISSDKAKEINKLIKEKAPRAPPARPRASRSGCRPRSRRPPGHDRHVEGRRRRSDCSSRTSGTDARTVRRVECQAAGVNPSALSSASNPARAATAMSAGDVVGGRDIRSRAIGDASTNVHDVEELGLARPP